jgi:hypothetical protein
MITVLMAMYDLDLKQRDAVNAFLNAILYEPVYTRMPPGHGIPGKIWKLLRALYSLWKLPWLWQEDLSIIIKAHGLQPVLDKECLFTNKFMLVLIYVNNILIINLPTYKGRAAAAQFTTALEEKYELKDMGELNWFLKMRVTRDQS